MSRSPKRPNRDAMAWMGPGQAIPRVGDSHIYVIAAPDANSVKIGISCDPFSRIDALRRAAAVPLYLHATWYGTYADEKALHIAWRHQHVDGEWFLAPQILAVVGPQWSAQKMIAHMREFHVGRAMTATLLREGAMQQLRSPDAEKLLARLRRRGRKSNAKCDVVEEYIRSLNRPESDAAGQASPHDDSDGRSEPEKT